MASQKTDEPQELLSLQKSGDLGATSQDLEEPQESHALDAPQQPGHILSLPAEIRLMIWRLAAMNCAWVNMLRTNKQIYRELRLLCRFPRPVIDDVHRLTFFIDSSGGQDGCVETKIEWFPLSNPKRYYTLGFFLNPDSSYFEERLNQLRVIRHINFVICVPPRTVSLEDACMAMLRKMWCTHYVMEEAAWRRPGRMPTLDGAGNGDLHLGSIVYYHVKSEGKPAEHFVPRIGGGIIL